MKAKDMGALSNRDKGDPFTEPGVYRNQTSPFKQLHANRRVEEHLRSEAYTNRLATSGGSGRHNGANSPAMLDEKASEILDQEMIHGSQRLPNLRDEMNTHRLLRREVERRDHVRDKFGEAPTSREFHQLFAALRSSDDDDGVVRRHQARLAEENGIYSSTRMDAYMLNDDLCFPEWVQALPYRIRDQVKYGHLGITEFEETERLRLARLTREKRLREWSRIKKAKQYQAAQEETLTLSELRDARQGTRRFHWLQRKRQRRASLLRRACMRKPDATEVWPTRMIDFSQKIAFIAKHVESGVKTNGQWPLDEPSLAANSVQENADGKQAEVNPQVAHFLQSFEEPRGKFKRLSRKKFANRVNAITHGDQDEYGRKYRRMKARATHRQSAYQSTSELELEKELRREPLPNAPGLNIQDDHNWSMHQRSWVEGMPSTRYGA